MGVLFSWWLVIELLGIVGLPLTATLLANLPDRGWALSKPLSLLLVGWLIWFPLTLIPALPFNRGWIIGTSLVFALGNAALLRRSETVGELRRLLTRHWGYVALSEGLFAGAFALMAWVRSFTPAVVDTEKFMDVAFLSAIWRAPHLPPPDPWLSGQPINYYYFGHYLMALPAKTLGTQPAVAFNVAIALTFALAATAIFGVATNITAVARRTPHGPLTTPAIAGLIAVTFTLVLGNLNGAQVWYHIASGLSKPGQPLHGNLWGWWTQRAFWPQYDWWAPSRVVPNTINEFPAFSFVLADLHAHVLALPFAALAIGLAFNLLLASGEGISVFGRRWVGWLCLVVSGVILGSLYAINGWDLPTYVGLAVLALLIQQWLAHERVIDTVLLIDLATVIIMLVALGLIFYFPFYRGFSSPGLGVGVVPANQHTPIGYEIAIFGLPLFLALSLIILRLANLAPRRQRLSTGMASAVNWPLVIGGVALALLALVTWRTLGGELWTLFWGLLIVIACAWLALRKLDFRLAWGKPDASDETNADNADNAPGAVDAAERAAGAPPAQSLRWSERAELWVYVLIGTATALVVTCELVYLRDIFGGTPPALGVDFRMNTVFKLYYQAWLIFGVVSGPLVAWLTRAAWRSLAAVIPSAATLQRLASGAGADVADAGEPQGALAFRALTARAFAAPIQATQRMWARWRIAWTQSADAGLAVAAPTSGGVARILSGRVALAAKGASSRSGTARRAAKSSAGGKGATASGGKPTMQTRQGKPSVKGGAPIRQPDVAAMRRAPEPASEPAVGASAIGASAVETAPGGLAATTSADADSEQRGVIADDADSDQVGVVADDGEGFWAEREGTGAAWQRPDVGAWLRAGVGAVWLAALVALVLAALIYPVMAVAARTDNLTQPRSLDGTSYMAYDTMNSGDQYAIAWLNTHVSGDEVIVEAATYNEYTRLGRVSAFTGLPTLMGWGGHEVQWRYNWLQQPERANTITQRLDAVNQIYTNTNASQVLTLLHAYDVRLVYVGAGERATYPNADLTRFASFLRVVYSYDGVTIYAVPY